MKRIFLSAFALVMGSLLFTACNNNEGGKANEEHDLQKDTTQHATANDAEAVKAIAVTYTNVDAQAATSIKAIANHYLQIKNALANDDAKEATDGARAMAAVIGKFDKSLLTADQKTAYDKNDEKLKEHATAIEANAGNIKEQRTHFVMLSETMYDFVKSFGAGRPVYHDHCPMARDNQGAMWLSETEAVKNPYFGAEMPTCGTVEEVIK